MSRTSPDGRFRLEVDYGSESGGDATWQVIDTRTGHQVKAFGWNTLSVEFSKDGREVIGTDGYGGEVDRFVLVITLPYDLDGVTIGLDTDFSALVKGVILEKQPAPGATKWEKKNSARWVRKLYGILFRSTDCQHLAVVVDQAVADLLPLIEDPEIREQVIEFYRLVPDAPGAARLVERCHTTPEEFVGIRGEDRGILPLESLFGLFVSARVEYLQLEGKPLDSATVEVMVQALVNAVRRVRNGDEVSAEAVETWLCTLRGVEGCEDSRYWKAADQMFRRVLEVFDDKLSDPLKVTLKNMSLKR